MHFTITAGSLTVWLLAFIPAIVNIGLAAYIFLRLPQRGITDIFILLLLSSSFWQLSAAMMRISADIHTALLMDNLLGPAGFITAPLMLDFAFRLKKQKNSRQERAFVTLCYLFTFVLLAMYPALNNSHSYIYSDFWGWINTRNAGIFSIVLGLGLQLQFFISLGVLFYNLGKQKKGTQKYYQILFILTPLFIIITQSLVTEAVLPLAFKSIPIPFTPTTMVTFSLATFYSFKKFNLFQGINSIDKEVILDSISDIVIVVDSDLKIAYVNPPGEKFLGYTHEELEKLDFTKLAGDFREAGSGTTDSILDKIRNFIAFKDLNSFLSSKTGSTIPVLVSCETINYGNKTEGLLLLCKNVSDLKRIQDEVRKIDHRFKKIIEKSRDVFALIDTEGTIKYISPSVEKVLGHEDSYFVGRNFMEFLHSDSLELAAKNFENALSTEGYQAKESIYKCVHKDSSNVWLESSRSNLLNDEDIESILVVFRDVTEKYKMQQELIEKNKFMELVLEIGQMGSWWANLEPGGRAYWSDEALQIYGLTREEFDGLAKTYFDFVHPDDLNLVYEVSGPAIKEKRPFSLEHRIVLRDGSVKWVYNRVYTEYNGDIPVTIIGIVHDISQRKKNEEEILHQNQELQKINKELDDLVYSASHDIRSPLTSVIGLINLALDEIEDPAATLYFKMIEDRIQRLDEFTLDIIHYRRNTKMEIVKEEIPVRSFLETVIEGLCHLEDAEGVSFEIEAKSGTSLCTDKSRLFIIVSNLVSNAIKYRRNLEDSFVKVSFECLDDKAVFIVNDNGEGIPEDKLHRVFDMFTRFSTESSGSGLGLYIVNEMVEKLRGKIEVSSIVGEGSEFKVSLPQG